MQSKHYPYVEVVVPCSLCAIVTESFGQKKDWCLDVLISLGEIPCSP